MGEGNIEVEVHEAGTGLLILGVMLGGGTFSARICAARPSHYLWLTGCSGRERRVRLTAMYGGLVTGPVMGLSSGCFVGLELVESKSSILEY